MRASITVSLSLAVLLAAPAANAGTYAGAMAVDAVRTSIAARDCSTAVKRLKSALDSKYPEAFVLAGSMYENGVCVKRDWSRAVDFYVQAHDAGDQDGSTRLAAGYADPANGPDVAAALWWAGKSPRFQQGSCGVPREAQGDPERFVAELAGWPKARLATCNYVTGVMATIAAEVKYPEQAADHGLGADVTLRFLPGVPRIEVQRGESHEYELVGWVDANTLRDRKTRKMADGFETALSSAANRALARYPHPGGIPQDTLVQVKFSFGIEGRMPRCSVSQPCTSD